MPTPIPDPLSSVLRSDSTAALAALMVIASAHRDLFNWAVRMVGAEPPAKVEPRPNGKAKQARRAQNIHVSRETGSQAQRRWPAREGEPERRRRLSPTPAQGARSRRPGAPRGDAIGARGNDPRLGRIDRQVAELDPLGAQAPARRGPGGIPRGQVATHQAGCAARAGAEMDRAAVRRAPGARARRTLAQSAKSTGSTPDWPLAIYAVWHNISILMPYGESRAR
jgi:hypothetical protein